MLTAVALLFGCLNTVQADSWYVGVLSDELKEDSTIEIGGSGFVSDHAFGQVSLFRLGSDDKIYTGFNASLSYAIGNPLSVYTGLGFFLGEYEDCEYLNFRKVCDDSDYAIGLYPEVGALLTIGGVQLGAYARHFAAFSGENSTMYGFRIGVRM